MDKFGPEVLSWSPETIRLEVKEEFQVELPRTCLDKIMAAAVIITSDDFYNNLPKFIQLCNVLADDEFNPTVFNPADSFEIAWGITESMLLMPPETEEPFNEEIRYYIGHVVSNEGLVNPPDVLQIALNDDLPDPLAQDTDDPLMYGAFYQTQQAKSDEIRNMLKSMLHALFTELESIKLQNGDTSNLLAKIQGAALNV